MYISLSPSPPHPHQTLLFPFSPPHRPPILLHLRISPVLPLSTSRRKKAFRCDFSSDLSLRVIPHPRSVKVLQEKGSKVWSRRLLQMKYVLCGPRNEVRQLDSWEGHHLIGADDGRVEWTEGGRGEDKCLLIKAIIILGPMSPTRYRPQHPNEEEEEAAAGGGVGCGWSPPPALRLYWRMEEEKFCRWLQISLIKRGLFFIHLPIVTNTTGVLIRVRCHDNVKSSFTASEATTVLSEIMFDFIFISSPCYRRFVIRHWHPFIIIFIIILPCYIRINRGLYVYLWGVLLQFLFKAFRIDLSRSFFSMSNWRVLCDAMKHSKVEEDEGRARQSLGIYVYVLFCKLSECA